MDKKIEELEYKIKGMIAEKQYISNQIEEAQNELKTLKTAYNIVHYINMFGEIGTVERSTLEKKELAKMNVQGNTFSTYEEAEKARQKRVLLTEINYFRNKCNGDWKPTWKMSNEGKYFIGMQDGKLQACVNWTLNNYSEFGIFENKKDCERAISKFGDWILRLYN